MDARGQFLIRCRVCGGRIGWDDMPDEGDEVCSQCEDE